eukprot:363906-Chlamydomonas_euryale.AAC.1
MEWLPTLGTERSGCPHQRQHGVAAHTRYSMEWLPTLGTKWSGCPQQRKGHVASPDLIAVLDCCSDPCCPVAQLLRRRDRSCARFVPLPTQTRPLSHGCCAAVTAAAPLLRYCCALFRHCPATVAPLLRPVASLPHHCCATVARQVRNTYGGQKLPCLLFFTRSDAADAASDDASAVGPAVGQDTAAARPSATPAGPCPPSGAVPAAAGAALQPAAEAAAAAPRPPAVSLPPGVAPVLTPPEFSSLCRSPPLQSGPAAKGVAAAVRFRPLDMACEAPRPGSLLAIDAEFVALAPLSDARAVD